jgi:hypothetical protein
MTEFYIGNRLAHSELNKALGQSLPKLNNKMAETLRSVAMKQGIKKTQQGAKLEFYAVSKEQLDTLTKASTQTLMALKGVEWRPLITVDAQKMTEALRKVNARYTGGMDYKTHQKYLKELEQAVEDSLHKISEDKKTAKAKYTNPGLKVGDIIGESNGWRTGTVAVVTKITDAGYQTQPYLPTFDPRNMYHQNWVEANGGKYSGDYQWDGNSSLPITEELFALGKKKSYRWTKYTHAEWLKRKIDSLDKAEYTKYWHTD